MFRFCSAIRSHNCTRDTRNFSYICARLHQRDAIYCGGGQTCSRGGRVRCGGWRLGRRVHRWSRGKPMCRPTPQSCSVQAQRPDLRRSPSRKPDGHVDHDPSGHVRMGRRCRRSRVKSSNARSTQWFEARDHFHAEGRKRSARVFRSRTSVAGNDVAPVPGRRKSNGMRQRRSSGARLTSSETSVAATWMLPTGCTSTMIGPHTIAIGRWDWWRRLL